MNEKTNEKWFIRAVGSDGFLVYDSVREGYDAAVSMAAIRHCFSERADIGEEGAPCFLVGYTFSRVA